MKHLIYLCVIACSMLSACNGKPQSKASGKMESEPQNKQTSTAFEGLSGRLLFQSDRSGNKDIYTMNVDGSDLVQLTRDSNSNQYPVWSPDGTQIAFNSNRDGNYEIYLMNADGTNQHKITDHPQDDYDPAWSPDGTRLAFSSERNGGGFEIYIMNVDGSGVTQFTKTPGRNILAAWSPDSTRMAYTGNRYLGWNVYVSTIDNTDDKRISDGHGACRPDWSPDASTIAFVSQKADGKGDIWTMKPDGSEKTRLTHDDVNYDYYPAWSPDGGYIAYTKTSDKQHGNWEIYIMTADGKEHLQITDHPAQEQYPDWRP